MRSSAAPRSPQCAFQKQIWLCATNKQDLTSTSSACHHSLSQRDDKEEVFSPQPSEGATQVGPQGLGGGSCHVTEHPGRPGLHLPSLPQGDPYEVTALRGHCPMSLLQEAPYEVIALRGHCLSRKPPMRSQLYEVTAFPRKPPMRSLPPSLPQDALMRSLYYKVTAL